MKRRRISRFLSDILFVFVGFRYAEALMHSSFDTELMKSLDSALAVSSGGAGVRFVPRAKETGVSLKLPRSLTNLDL